ncbi:serine hydrolase [Algoriphagus sp.]|uniref:serine hydrolase domain-containing protein n=1 Tax=Algoriphagus sp. TaxID=1872435 RepID=UPI0025D671C0|nr:serine hydrolase domain-containing protein [Algoriphagus sp.]
MKKLFLLFLVFGITIIIGCQSKENLPPESKISTADQRIDSLFRSRYAQDLFQGGVVITQHGKTIYENYLGQADRSWGIPFDEEVKLDIASVNKSMIAALSLKAVEEGLLKLDDKLVDLLSDFSYKGHFHPEITLHHLLSHSSGLADYDGVSEELRQDSFLKFKRSRFTNEGYVDFISQIEPINEPGKQFYYSNFAYHLVAIIIAEAYSKPFAQVLEEKLAIPLGLKNTVSEGFNETVIPKLAQAYTYQEATNQWMETPFIDLSLSRRIFSTASDLNRWAQVMDNPGWLTENSLKLMKQNHQARISKSISYGYGWVIFDEENKSEMGDLGIEKPYIIHGGSTDGYKSMLININSGEYVISFLSNVGDKTNEMQLAQKIIEILIK